MKIVYLDPNNDTPQINYPLVSKLEEDNNIDVKFVSTFNRFSSKYYSQRYSIEVDYLFFKIANKISKQILRRYVKLLTYTIYNIILLLKMIRNKADIIHYNWVPIPFIDLIFIKIYKLIKIKIILTQHNFYQHGKRRIRLFERNIFNNVDRIICLSEFVKNQFKDNGFDNIVKIDHGNCYETEIAEIETGIEKYRTDVFRVLFTGSIKNYKGIELLLQTANELINVYSVKNISFHISGNSTRSYEDKLRKIIIKLNLIDYVRFQPSFLSDKQLFSEVVNCDCGILPYLEATQSGLPYIFYSFNRPLVITNVGGLSEQCDKNIAIVSEPRSDALAQSIITMMKNKGNIDELHFKNFLRKYSWDRTIEKYKKVYKEILGENI